MAAGFSHPSRSLALALTPLVGRGALLAAVRGALADPETRLLTLVGPAGVGKTRLAVEVVAATTAVAGNAAAAGAAEAAGDRRVCFVPLADVTDPALVLPAIAGALEVRQAGDRPLLANLIDALRDEQTLLILDNFEQVVSAAADLPALLAACPGLKVLVTSRASLELSAERELSVPPLAIGGGGGEGSAAVELFLQRARAVNPDLPLTPANLAAIAAICRRLDGLPLAIELAASRVATLSPEALLGRLERRLPLLTRGARNLPDRQRTLHDAIAWSYDLLTPPQQTLFRRLSVYAGGFTLDVVEGGLRTEDSGLSGSVPSLAPSNLPTGDATDSVLSPQSSVLDALAALVGQSLVQAVAGPDGEVRFRFLETIREFGLERLEASGAATGEAEAMRRRHAETFLALAEQAEPALLGPEQAVWLPRLAAEHDNFAAALEWAFAHDAATATRLVAALWQFWFVHAELVEGRRWLERTLARLDAADPLRPNIALGAATLGWAGGDYAKAAAHARESLAACRAAGEQLGIAVSSLVLGLALLDLGDDEAAQTAFEEALALSRALDAPQWAAHALTQLAFVLYRQGEFERAAAACEEALRNERAREDNWSAALTLSTFGQIVRDQADYRRAAACFAESLNLWWALGDRWNIVHALTGLAGVAGAGGHATDAATLLGAADRLRQLNGSPLSPSNQTSHDRFVDAARARLGAPAFAAAWAAGRALSPEGAVARARAIIPWLGADAPPPPRLATPAGANLTKREMEVLHLLIEGRSNKDIADRLFISVRTGTTHVTHILSKLGVESRAAAVAYALQHRL